MDLKLDVRGGEVLIFARIENQFPNFIHAIGHLVNVELLFVETALHFLLGLDQEVDFLLRHLLLLRLLLL